MDVIDSNGDFTPRDQFRWSAYNIAGTRLFSIEFNNATNDIYYILDDDVPHLIGNLFSNNTLFLVKMTVDFSRNTWSATLNGAPLVAAVPVVTGTESPDLGGFRAEWVLNTAFAGDNYMLFDNYTVTESNLVLPISIWKSANFSALGP